MSKKVKRLFQGFQPKRYQLELTPDRDTMHLAGNIVIQGQKIGRPSQRITLHQKDLKVTSATISRHDKKGTQEFAVVRISHHKSYDEVRIHTEELLYAGTYTLTLSFSGAITDGMHGVYPCYYELDGKKQSLIATQFESHHAREAFPCIDEPEAKATFDLTLISPAGETALGNTPVQSQTEENGKCITVFETTPKMSTYLLAFAYGDLQSHTTHTKDGVAVSLWATKAHSSEALTFGLDVAKRSIEFFNDYFGVAYPLPKADHIALPDFSSGAMENWGLITYREATLLADPKTTSQSSREHIAMVIAHETSHQWFGNLVTMKWWDDLWLNESFANVMEYVAVDALFPQWHIWNAFITQEGLSAIRRDAIAGVQAVKTPVHHPDEISSLFDPSIVYAKGGRLLRMLMQYVGEKDFRAGLKAYFTKHAYGNTTGNDLWEALGAASGKNVAAFMDPWLIRSGFPVIQVTQEGSNLHINQEHFLMDPSKADVERIWPVPLLSSRPDVPALLESKALSAQLDTPDFIQINEGASGHYVVQYTQSKHSTAVAALVKAGKLGVAERLVLLSDSAMLARSGHQSFADTLALLECYAAEDQDPVWDIIALILADSRRFIDQDSRLEAPIKTLIRHLIAVQFARLGWDEKPGEPVQDTKLRATITSLGIYAGDEAITEGALLRFAAYQKDASSIPSQLRGIIFGAAVRNHVKDAFTYLLQLEESTSNVDLKHDITGALTACKREAEVVVLLGRLQDSDKVRPQDLIRWIAFLLRNRYSRELMWKWLRDNWEWIETTFAGDKSYDYFPRYAASAFNTRSLLKEYQTFFTPLQDNPALARNITMGIEEIENRVGWLERDVPAVTRSLSKY